MTSCPDEATLRLLDTDTLAEAAYLSIEQHVEECARCQALLERLAQRHRHPVPVLPGPDRLPRIPGFEIQAELARGGMGVVYRATRPGLDRPIALKVLPGSEGSNAGAAPRRRWLREARAIASVRHPNVVPLYDFGEADGWFFLVLEFIPGGTLKQRLDEPLPPRVAAGLMETIARAVGYVHGRGLLHLDLKPSNILLDCEVDAPWDRVIPRISDFGLALPDDGSGASERSIGGVRGTPSYMAPEQASPSRAGVTAAADIHALGAILYELLTGRPPFQGSSALETLDQVRDRNPVPPRKLNPKLPRDLETITLKCLEKHPERRYLSAQALAEDLTSFLAGSPIKARPVSPLEHSWRWCRRRPTVAALAATLLMTVSLGLLVFVRLWKNSQAVQIRAELERSHADSEFKFATISINSVISLVMRGLQTKELPDEQLIGSLHHARRHILEIAKPRPDDPGLWWLLAYTDLHLAKSLDQRGKSAEARPFHLEAVANWEKLLHEKPNDLFALHHRWESLTPLAIAAEQRGDVEEAERRWERVISVCEGMMPLMMDRELVSLTEARFSLARLAERRGDHERARSLLGANLRMRGRLSPEITTTRITRVESLTWEQLGPLMAQSPPREFEGLSARDWARGVADLLVSTADAGADPARGCDGVARLLKFLGARVAFGWPTASLDDTRRTAGRIHALVELVAARYPEQPAARDPERWRLLALTDLVLAKSLDQRSRSAEARPFHLEAVANWEKLLREKPNDLFALHHRWESLTPLAIAAEQRGDVEEAERRWERVISVCEGMMPLMMDRELVSLTEARFSLARLAERRGDHERARSLLGANLRMRGRLSPEITTTRVTDLESRTREQLRILLAKSPPREFEDLPAEEWARSVAARLISSSGAAGADPTRECELAYRLIQSLEGRAVSERRASRLDEARRTADRIQMLAELVVARYPDQSLARLCKSASFQQRAKNAWQVDDRGTVLRNWELALEESRQALRLDPQDLQARRDVTGLQKKLDDLLAPQRAAKGQASAGQPAVKAGT